MKYTLAQIFGALGGVENGQEMISSLQGIIDENKKTDKSGEILQKLGVNSIDELEKVVSTLNIFKKAGNDPNTLAKQVTELSNQVNEFKTKFEESEAKAKAERDNKEISIADGVKAWLEANPSAVKNNIQPGAGSKAGAEGGAKMTVQQLSDMDIKEYMQYRNSNKE